MDQGWYACLGSSSAKLTKIVKPRAVVGQKKGYSVDLEVVRWWDNPYIYIYIIIYF